MDIYSSSVRSKKNITREYIEEIFTIYDQSGTGFINIKKLKMFMRSLGLEPRQDEVKQITKQMLTNEIARSVNPEAFNSEEIYHLLATRYEENCMMEEIPNVFMFFDTEGKGYITISDLRKVANELDENYDDDDLKEMVNLADFSKKGRVYPNEFKVIMKKNITLLKKFINR